MHGSKKETTMGLSKQALAMIEKHGGVIMPTEGSLLREQGVAYLGPIKTKADADRIAAALANRTDQKSRDALAMLNRNWEYFAARPKDAEELVRLAGLTEQLDTETEVGDAQEVHNLFVTANDTIKAARATLLKAQTGDLARAVALLRSMTAKKAVITATGATADAVEQFSNDLKDVLKSLDKAHDAFAKAYPDAIPAEDKKGKEEPAAPPAEAPAPAPAPETPAPEGTAPAPATAPATPVVAPPQESKAKALGEGGWGGGTDVGTIKNVRSPEHAERLLKEAGFSIGRKQAVSFPDSSGMAFYQNGVKNPVAFFEQDGGWLDFTKTGVDWLKENGKIRNLKKLSTPPANYKGAVAGGFEFKYGFGSKYSESAASEALAEAIRESKNWPLVEWAVRENDFQTFVNFARATDPTTVLPVIAATFDKLVAEESDMEKYVMAGLIKDAKFIAKKGFQVPGEVSGVTIGGQSVPTFITGQTIRIKGLDKGPDGKTRVALYEPNQMTVYADDLLAAIERIDMTPM